MTEAQGTQLIADVQEVLSVATDGVLIVYVIGMVLCYAIGFANGRK